MSFRQVRCKNNNCKKLIGEIEHGKSRFYCRFCKTYTTVTISIETTSEPRDNDINKPFQDRLGLVKK